MCSTLLMMAFVLFDHPWRDPVINNLHLANEVFIYLTCIFLLLFNSFISADMRFTLGYILIVMITIFIVYNGLMMLRKVYKLAKLVFVKWRQLKRYLSLRREASKIMRKVKKTLEEIREEQLAKQESSEEEKDIIEDSMRLEEEERKIAERPIPMIYKTKLRPCETGGLRGEIVEDKQAVEDIRQARLRELERKKLEREDKI